MKHQIEAKSVSKGDYVMIDDEPCEVRKVNKSAPGKHGHAKFRIQAEGIFDEKVRNVTKSGEKKLLSPSTEKKVGQIVSKDGDISQVMDMDTYETEEMKMPEEMDVSEGEEIRFQIIGDRKKILGKND
ncbi:MAG: translation initiation factor IF-5A [Candidatus Nanohaloarchaeota archaeon QJJ-9]|nr:translation initiation factor IF-5A [Candidatus Nanohaloarchaeota archaeon QJJ-9]